MPCWDVRRLASVDSTNRWVMDSARAGAPEGLVAVADVQTAGRGRLDRRWESPAGANLLCSVLLRPPVADFWTTAAVALAARGAAESVAGVDAGLKWPNDLVVGEAKLAGVLAEAGGGAAVVGLGLNLAWAPGGAARLGPGVDRDEVLEAFLDSLTGWLAAPATVPGAYRQACLTLGRDVRVEVAGGAVSGRAVEVDGTGRLVLVPGSGRGAGAGRRAVAAGDVVHLR